MLRGRSSSLPTSARSTKKYVPIIRCDGLNKHDIKGIPNYAGYIPGKRAETIGEGTFSQVLYESQHGTTLKCHNEQDAILDRDMQRGARRFPHIYVQPTGSTQETLREMDNKRGDEDMQTGWVPAAGDYRESRVLNSHESFYEEPLLDNTLKAKTNIPGYGGHLPGREAENVYGNTWHRTNMNAVSAFYHTYRGRNRPDRSDPLAIEKGRSRLYPRQFYTCEQNRRNKSLFTKEGTAIERLESDDKNEIPMYSSSYQDVRRGWSLDPWVGKQVDPAGRLEPFTRQESYGCIPPPRYQFTPGYQGYIPGKVAENVVAERQTIEAYISKHRRNKNKAEYLQR